MELSMVNVALPLPAFGKVVGPGAGGEISREEYAFQMKVQGLLQRKLLEERNLGPTRYYHNGRLWLRISGQVWLEVRGRFMSVVDGLSAEVLTRWRTLRRSGGA